MFLHRLGGEKIYFFSFRLYPDNPPLNPMFGPRRRLGDFTVCNNNNMMQPMVRPWSNVEQYWEEFYAYPEAFGEDGGVEYSG